MENIIIENKNLADYIMFKVDKDFNGFTDEELNKITEVILNYDEEDGVNNPLEDLLKLNKLSSLIMRNAFIYNDDYNILLKIIELSKITFDNCSFENPQLIASLSNIKSLSLINCEIDDYVFINILKNIEELTITSGSIKIEKINMLSKLKTLQLSYSKILDEVALSIDGLEELYVDNTNISDFSFINDLKNIKKISIDEKQYDNNKELFDKCMSNGIIVMDENMVEFGGDGNEY